MKPHVLIYSDGACDPNPGIGGWGAVLIFPARENYRRELSGAVRVATNQRMELLGAVEALQALKRPCEVVLHTDARYVCDAFLKGWIEKWHTNGWRNSSREAVANQDLWQELLNAKATHDVTWRWVRGHADVIENNRCDELAVAARERLRDQLRAQGDRR